MSSIAVSMIVFACVFGGTACGIFLSRALPPHHLSTGSKDTVRMGMGLVATMAALVLGLLISSAKSFDAQSAELTQVSARIILLDRLLAHYGPETKEARDLLRGAVADSIDRIWPQERTRRSELRAPSSGPEALLVTIQELSPKDDRQRSIQGQALNIAIGLAQTRWSMYEQGVGSVSPAHATMAMLGEPVIASSASRSTARPVASSILAVYGICLSFAIINNETNY
jgi:hypothetical protein